MDIQGLQSQYYSLKAQLVAGQITVEQFYQAVAQLQFSDTQGAVYRIDPESGGWLMWTGQGWEPVQIEEDPGEPQDLNELQALYRHLRAEMETGRITPEFFHQEVCQLQFTDTEGRAYCINPEDGGWLVWNGQAWETIELYADRSMAQEARATQPAQASLQNPTPPTPQPQAVTSAQHADAGPTGLSPVAGQRPLPTTFLPLFWLTLKQTLISFLVRLPIIAVFMALYAWWTFQYVVVKSDGYTKVETGFFWERMLGMDASAWWFAGGLFFSIVLAGLIGFFNLAIKRKVTEAFTAFAQMPELALKLIKGADLLAWSSIVNGAGLALVLGSLLNNSTSTAMVVGIGAIFGQPAGRGLSLLTLAAWRSMFRSILAKSQRDVPPTMGHYGMIGGGLGFLLNICINSYCDLKDINIAISKFVVTRNFHIPELNVQIIFGLVLLIASLYMVYSAIGGSQRLQPATVFYLVSAAVLAYRFIAHAHDGGWVESGSNYADWVAKGGLPVRNQIIAGAASVSLIPALVGGWSRVGNMVSSAVVIGPSTTDVQVGNIQGATDEIQTEKRQPDEDIVLSGQDAIDWLKDHNQLDADNQKTDQWWRDHPWIRGVAFDPKDTTKTVVVLKPESMQPPVADVTDTLPDPDAQSPGPGQAGTATSGSSAKPSGPGSDPTRAGMEPWTDLGVPSELVPGLGSGGPVETPPEVSPVETPPVVPEEAPVGEQPEVTPPVAPSVEPPSPAPPAAPPAAPPVEPPSTAPPAAPPAVPPVEAPSPAPPAAPPAVPPVEPPSTAPPAAPPAQPPPVEPTAAEVQPGVGEEEVDLTLADEDAINDALDSVENLIDSLPDESKVNLAKLAKGLLDEKKWPEGLDPKDPGAITQVAGVQMDDYRSKWLNQPRSKTLEDIEKIRAQMNKPMITAGPNASDLQKLAAALSPTRLGAAARILGEGEVNDLVSKLDYLEQHLRSGQGGQR